MPEQERPQAEFIPLADIIVPEDRHRKQFDPVELTELRNSIRSHGLFHALQVRADGRTLVSGERRFRALSDPILNLAKDYTYGAQPVPPGHVPVIRVSSDDPLDLEEIEFAENVARTNLTWQELAETTARLEALRSARAGQAAAKMVENPENAAIIEAAKKPTLQSLTQEIRKDVTTHGVETTRQELIVAKHLDNPEVRKAKTLKEALKVVQRQDTARQMLALGASVGKTFSAEMHKLYFSDCRLLMKIWAEDPEGPRFDVILTDPPYGMGADQFGDGAGRLSGIEHDYDDSYEHWKELLRVWADLAYRVAKPQAHAYVFCDFDRFHELKQFMLAAGWYVFRTPLVNVKKNSGRVPLPDQGPRRQYEICLYAIKGKKKVNSIQSDVIVSEADEQMSHGAQKPVELYEDLLRRSVRPGDTVLDSFAGSGTIFPAAHTFKCVAYGIEGNSTYYGVSLSRIEALTAQKELLA